MPNIIRVLEKREGKWVCLDDEGDIVLLDECPHVHTSSPSHTEGQDAAPAPRTKKKARDKGR